MEKSSVFNPRQRFHEAPVPPPAPVPAEPPLVMTVPPVMTEDFSKFIEKTIEYKNRRITLEDYQDELVKWFPIFKNFQSIYLDINIVYPQQAAHLNISETSTHSSINSHEYIPDGQGAEHPLPNPPPMASTSNAQESLSESEGSGMGEGEAEGVGEGVENGSQVGEGERSKSRIMRSHIKKLKYFWSGNSTQAPHTFKKKICHIYENHCEKFFIEKLDMSKKLIRPGGAKEDCFKSYPFGPN